MPPRVPIEPGRPPAAGDDGWYSRKEGGSQEPSETDVDRRSSSPEHNTREAYPFPSKVLAEKSSGEGRRQFRFHDIEDLFILNWGKTYTGVWESGDWTPTQRSIIDKLGKWPGSYNEAFARRELIIHYMTPRRYERLRQELRNAVDRLQQVCLDVKGRGQLVVEVYYDEGNMPYFVHQGRERIELYDRAIKHIEEVTEDQTAAHMAQAA